MIAISQKPLWSCPRCGAKLVSKNMSHSCGVFSLDALFASCDPDVRRTFDALKAAIGAAASDVILIPQKTRAVFQLRTRFISVYPRKSHLLAGFVFPGRNPNERFVKIEGPITGVFVHYARLVQPTEVDASVRDWIDAALPYGRQDRPLGRRRTTKD